MSVQPSSTILPGRADAEGWRRLHKITPVLKSWKVVAAAAVFFGHQQLQQLGEIRDATHGGFSLPPWFVIFGGIALFVALIGVWSVISWRATKYRVTADTIEFHSGVLSKQQKQAPLDRLQAVDVVRPLLGQIFGLSELKLEVAGGHGSDFRLAYLTDDDAQLLRHTLLANAAGVSYETDGPVPQAPEIPVYALGTDRLLKATLLSGATAWMLFAAIAAIVSAVVIGEVRAVVAIVGPALGAVAATWATFSRRFNFTVATSPDGLRLRHGLTEHRAQTVPPGRVQAVAVSQPLLWRKVGWWQVDMNVAGYASASHEEKQEGSETVLVPVATRDELNRILPLVFPDLGHPDPFAVIDAGLTGVTGDDVSARTGFICAPPQTKWLDFFGWKRHGVLVTQTGLLLRGGLLRRRLVMVPHARMQSVGVEQGPIQRRLAVASMVVHSTPGPIKPRVEHLAAATVGVLVQEQAARSRQARAGAAPERWMAAIKPAPVDSPGALDHPAAPVHPVPPGQGSGPARPDRPAASGQPGEPTRSAQVDGLG